MRSRASILVFVLLVAGVGLLAVATAGTVDASQTATQSAAVDTSGVQTAESVVESCADEPPDDFSDPEGGTEDVIGWVDGYWYDEPLDIDTDNELTERELRKLANRTAARFEAMRCLPAVDGVPPVEIITREEFRSSSVGAASTDGELTDQQVFDNTKLRTLLMVADDEDSTEVRDEQRGEVVAGFYDFVREEIVIVSDDPDSLLIDESILAHEIGHAIQDQHFDLSRYERPTVDINNGKLGLIEGDVHLIEHRYLEACEFDLWEEPCVTIDRDVGGPGDADDPGDADEVQIPSWGLYFKNFQPYSDGPAFIEYIYEQRGGWEGVNELYDDPPRSAIEVAHPEKYGEFEPADVEVPDRSGDGWERVVPGGTNESEAYDTLGIAGIAAMFVQPTLEGEPASNQVFAFEDIVNVDETGQVDMLNPHNYDHPETEGWRDDKLVAYRSTDNETASVWRLAWASEADAQPFVESYGRLVEARGGEPVDGFEYTHVFDDGAYDMAVTVVPEGEGVTVITAPDVDALTEVHRGIDLVESGETDERRDDETGTGEGDENGDTTDDAGGADGADDTDGPDDIADTDDTEDADDPDDAATDADDDGVGFGVAAVAGALIVLTLLGLRRP